MEDIKKRVATIRSYAALQLDDRKCHEWEDSLRADVLRAIADGAQDSSDLAFEALKTTEIHFTRECS